VLDLIIRNLPGGIPQPDGNLEIREAGLRERFAQHSYMHALRRFSDFMMTGKAPEDLRRSLKRHVGPTQP
jgi:hypothetical protein